MGKQTQKTCGQNGEKKFNRCGFFDPSLKHGGPRPAEIVRKRRDDSDDNTIMDCDENENELCPRYDKNNPVRGLQQIIKGYEKWCTRYIADCGVPAGRDPTPAEILVKKFKGFHDEMLEIITPDN